MNTNKMIVTAFAGLLLGACSSVEVPEEIYYRVALPEAATTPLARGGVLRIEPLTLASSISEDGVMVQEGSVRLRPYSFHRWVAPLDQLVTDAVHGAMLRGRCFQEVVGVADDTQADYALSGRIVDFQQVVTEESWNGVVTLNLRLQEVGPDSGFGGPAVFQTEFSVMVPADTRHPEAGVRALSNGLAQVCEQLVQQMVQVGALEGANKGAYPGQPASPVR